MLAAALLLIAQTADPDASKLTIPPAYQGRWALDAASCAKPGPANVTIGARRIDFYERHGFLDLAQLNEAEDPPVFHGSFRWVELLHFTSGVVRLEMENGRLFITEGSDPDAARNPMAWINCVVK
jgi:hypothetical protein